MGAKSTAEPLELPLNTTRATAGNTNEEFVFNYAVFDTGTVSALQSVFNLPNTSEDCIPETASVKFMITMQDEKDLCTLGYSKELIDKLKPQEVLDILKTSRKTDPTNGQVYSSRLFDNNQFTTDALIPF